MKSQTGKAKAAPKAVSKTAKARPVAPVMAKPSVKPAKKASPKLASARSGKATAKTSTKRVTAKTIKPVPKAKAIKPVPKAKAKPVAKAKLITKAAAKALKPIVKAQPKDSVKLNRAKASKPDVPAAPAKVKPKLKVVPGARSAPPAIPVVAPPSGLAGNSVPVRAGRPSSRLAQLTVPSMAQSVASTAAKSSFSQAPSAALLVPPLASAVKKDPKLANNWKTKPLDQLTEADVNAMSDDVYMNDVQLAFFRRKLLTLKNDILSNAGATTEHLRADTVVVPDPADRATIEEEHALELRTRDRERKLLKKIDQSIARIDSGDYGYCDETGEPIGVGRLLARPTANLSLEAQQRRELKQKMFGD